MCPVCGGNEYSTLYNEVSDGVECRRVCSECGSIWIDRYEHIAFRLLYNACKGEWAA